MFALGTNNLIERQTSDQALGPNPKPSCCQGSNEQAACDVCLLRGGCSASGGDLGTEIGLQEAPNGLIASGGGDLAQTRDSTAALEGRKLIDHGVRLGMRRGTSPRRTPALWLVRF